ncbi:MAG: hypothetical protein ACXW33_04870 [Sulfuricurvum sp.]
MVGKPLPSFTQEPFSIEIDTNTEAKIMEEIYTICENKTLIVIAHRLSTLEGCETHYKIQEGRLHEAQ